MHPPYRREGATWQIDLQLDHLQQLVNSMDPSPFPGRDLDPEPRLEAALLAPDPGHLGVTVSADHPWTSGAPGLP